MTIFTIGFTRKSAEAFFTQLQRAGVTRLVDVRLNNTSQLAGFTKRDDLLYFTRAIAGIEYRHLPQLAPTTELLTSYRKGNTEWRLYERRFLDLMRERAIERTIARDLLGGACLLCSEESPDRCHRRLVAEYLQHHWGEVAIEHLR
jgi:uncharacterized protein (DUF488 family)